VTGPIEELMARRYLELGQGVGPRVGDRLVDHAAEDGPKCHDENHSPLVGLHLPTHFATVKQIVCAVYARRVTFPLAWVGQSPTPLTLLTFFFSTRNDPRPEHVLCRHLERTRERASHLPHLAVSAQTAANDK